MGKAIGNMIITIIVFGLLIVGVFASVSTVAPINELHRQHTLQNAP